MILTTEIYFTNVQNVILGDDLSRRRRFTLLHHMEISDICILPIPDEDAGTGDSFDHQSSSSMRS